MKSLWLVPALMVGFIVNFPVTANDDFNSGMDYAGRLKGKELDNFKSFKPQDNLPNYSSSPDATKYYGGVQSTGVDLTSPGSNQLNSTEWGKAVTDSVSKQPKDMVTADSTFLDNGRNAENNARTVFDPKLCKSKQFEKSIFNNYVCERDLQVQQYCIRKAVINLEGEKKTENKIMTLIPSAGFISGDSSISLSVNSQDEFDVRQVVLKWYYKPNPGQSGTRIRISALGLSGELNMSQQIAGNVNFHIMYGQQINIDIGSIDGGFFTQIIFDHITKYRDWIPEITLIGERTTDNLKPVVMWSENCPFDKAEGRLTATQCIEPAANRTVYRDGKPYSAYQDCWAYRDSYLTQSESDGTCGAYIHNAACNSVNQQCVDQENGACLHANITYSCETKTKGQGQVCGNELFCTDGSCVLNNNGKNDMFAKAASELAAVAAAGKDVAELNSNDVKIFTGKGVSCKKFAAGFNNCCKDSGWGQDLGLASCSSDEKALGKAKEKRLTVYVGEYCSKKVLGVCLEKKRGYCEFDSKLAQIIQQQGRSWQLGIGFGSGSSPDCRGITPEELQKIDFSKVDFSAFYNDLNSGSDIPADNNQMEKMKERMKAMFDQGSSH